MAEIDNDEFATAIINIQDGVKTYDMSLAREIWRNKIRRVRYAKMQEWDAEYQKADEKNILGGILGNSRKSEVAGKRQKLRDAPQDSRIDQATTVDQLKAVWPTILSEEVVKK